MPAAWCRFRVCLLHAAAPVVCYIVRVASVPCCALVVEDNASRMLLLVRCPLLAAHEVRQCRVFPLASRMCSRALACRRLSVARCLLSVACVAWFTSFARCLPHAACCLVALLPCCLLSMVFSKIPRRLLHAARFPLHAACCMLRFMSLLSAACC